MLCWLVETQSCDIVILGCPVIDSAHHSEFHGQFVISKIMNECHFLKTDDRRKFMSHAKFNVSVCAHVDILTSGHRICMWHSLLLIVKHLCRDKCAFWWCFCPSTMLWFEVMMKSNQVVYDIYRVFTHIPCGFSPFGMPERGPVVYTRLWGTQNHFYRILDYREKRQTRTPCSLKSAVYDLCFDIFSTLSCF